MNTMDLKYIYDQDWDKETETWRKSAGDMFNEGGRISRWPHRPLVAELI